MPLEFLIGSRVTLIAGVVSLLLGAAFFIELTNAQHPIPPEVRVLCGLVAGLALLFGGAWSLGRIRVLVAEAITGLGASVLYVSLWGAFGPLHLVGEPLAFAGMIATSAALAGIGWLRRSENLALVGLAGGAATPLLLWTQPLGQPTLAAYAAILCGAQLALASRCGFRKLEVGAFVVSVLYVPSLAPNDSWSTMQSLIGGTLLYGELAAAFFVAARREGTVTRERLALWIAETVTYLCAAEMLLWHHAGLHALVDGLAGGALVAIALRGPRGVRVAALTIGLAALTRATDVWAGSTAMCEFVVLQGMAFIYAGVRTGNPRLRRIAYVLLSVAAAGGVYHLALDDVLHPFFNDTTALAAGVAAACALMLGELRAYSELFDHAERDLLMVFASLGLAAFPVAALSIDAIAATAVTSGWTTETQTLLSALWSVAAAILVGWGLRSGNIVLRSMGLLLFAVTVGKVIGIDLWPQLDTLGRVISCSLLGTVLIAVAAAYQFFFSRDRRTA